MGVRGGSEESTVEVIVVMYFGGLFMRRLLYLVREYSGSEVKDISEV